jgi:hypothetical protein
MREEFESAYAVWWEKVPYSLGAYHRTPRGAHLEQLSKADGRIFMGSAGANSRPAWLEGAIQAAWRTVEAVHERAMAGQVAPLRPFYCAGWSLVTSNRAMFEDTFDASSTTHS